MANTDHCGTSSYNAIKQKNTNTTMIIKHINSTKQL